MKKNFFFKLREIINNKSLKNKQLKGRINRILMRQRENKQQMT